MSAPARPPPVPRRHPSRPSLSAAFSSSSLSPHAGPSPDLPPLPTHANSNGSPALPAARNPPPDDNYNSSHHPLNRTSAPHQHPHSSNVWNGLHPSTPASDLGDPSSPSAMRHTNAGLGTANIGLGPVLLDFKDWVKAGQSTRDSASTVVAGGDRRQDQQQSRPQHHLDLQPRNSYGSVFSGSNRSAEADYSGASVRESYSSYGGGSSEYTSSSPQAPYRSSPIPRTIPAHSLPSSNSRASISSLSIDSSHSPKLLGRAASRVSDRPPVSDNSMRSTATATSKTTSHDFMREMNTLSLQGSGRTSRSSHHHVSSQSPLGSPAGLSDVHSPLGSERVRRQQSAPAMSPLERRFSRRLMERHNSQSSNIAFEEHMEEEEEEEISSRVDGSLDERIREAEEKLARRASLRDSPSKSTTPNRRFHSTSAGLRSPMSPPLTNGDTPPHDQSLGSSGLQSGSTARGGRLRQPIPAEFHQNEHMFTPSPGDSRFSGQMVELNSPLSPPSYQNQEREEIVSPRRPMSGYRPQSSMDSKDIGPNPFNRNRMSRTFSRDLDQQASTPGGRRELPPRARPESVLETSADHQRYNSFGSSRRMSGFGGEQPSQRLSALLSSDRDYNTRHSRDLGATFGQRRDSTYSRNSMYSQRDSVYSQRDTNRDSLVSKRNSLNNRNSHLSQRDSLSHRDSYYSQRSSRDFTRDSLRDSLRLTGDMRGHAHTDAREILGPSHSDSREFPRELRDFQGGRGSGALAPSDSISAVGSVGGHSAPRVESRAETPRKDPLEIIRRLEETRSKANRQWEEDRSASVMGKYGEREMLARLDDSTQSTRPGSRMSASRLGPRPASSMSSVRDSGYGGPGSAPRTAPGNARRRIDSGNSSNLDSPLVGRTSRASGSFTGPHTEPRLVRRSLTSAAGLSSSARSGASSDQAPTDHGRNLVEAARVLEQRAEIPSEILAKLASAAALAERANTGVRAANQMATDLAFDIELDEPTNVASVRSRFPRLAVTLKEANRASDQAVRDLTEALLAARGATTTAATTPARPVSRMETTRSELRTPLEATHRRAMTLDSPATTVPPRHSPSTSPAAVMSSPLMQSSGPYRDHSSDRSETWTPASSRTDPPLSSTSSRFEAHHLDPIEQSPPKMTKEQMSPGVGLGISTPSPKAPWSDRPSIPDLEIQPHSLRKQASMLSTHTVRGNSFLPSHPPEPTTALSNSPAYSTTLPHLPDHLEHPENGEPEGDEVTQDIGSMRHKDFPNRGSIASIASVYSNPESMSSPTSMHHQTGSDISRTGTFGAAQGAQIRASVSERFRKHLSGE